MICPVICEVLSFMGRTSLFLGSQDAGISPILWLPSISGPLASRKDPPTPISEAAPVIGVLPFQVFSQGYQPSCAFRHRYPRWDEVTFSTDHSDLEDLKEPQVCVSSHATGNVPQVPSDTPTLNSLLF